MKVKAIILCLRDGGTMVSALVPMDFDTQEWLDKRRASLQFLGIVRVEEQIFESGGDDDDGRSGARELNR